MTVILPLPKTQKWLQQVIATTATCFTTCPLHPFSNTTESWMTSTLHIFHQFTLTIIHSLLSPHFPLSASIDVFTLLPLCFQPVFQHHLPSQFHCCQFSNQIHIKSMLQHHQCFSNVTLASLVRPHGFHPDS